MNHDTLQRHFHAHGAWRSHDVYRWLGPGRKNAEKAKDGVYMQLQSDTQRLHYFAIDIFKLNTKAMKEYNGHRSWNAWNVALWINNDEMYYNDAQECLRRCSYRAGFAATMFIRNYGKYHKTPDGAILTHLSVKLALEGMIE